MFDRLMVCLLGLGLAGVSLGSTNAGPTDVSPDRMVEWLREYCAACHGYGDREFLVSDDNGEVWRYIRNEPAPHYNRWIDGIIHTLSWPTEDPPKPSDVIEPGRHWMPRGTKRIDIARDQYQGRSVRKVLLEGLKEARRQRFLNR